MTGALPDLAICDTFPKLLLHNAAHWPGDVAMREKEYGIWNAYNWADCLGHVKTIALGLKSLGAGRGDVVAIIGRNRPNWLWSELAAHCIGGMTIGIYEDVLAEEAGYLVSHSRARFVIAEDEEQVDKILALGDAAATVQCIIYHDPRGMRKYDDPRLVTWAGLADRAQSLERASPDLFENEIAAGEGEDVAILCTTSGTTARPKLAMLQHRPFLQHAVSYMRVDPRTSGDEYVVMLPLPWIMEQVYCVAMPLLSRITINFPESPDTVMHDMREIGPTHLLLAPRVWEQTAADVRARIMDSSWLNRRIFDKGVDMGLDALERGRRSMLAELMLFRTLKDRLGFARVKSAATGGAALGPDTFRFFLAMGIPLRQLYGQTELSGAYTLQRGHVSEFDSSGVPFDDAEVRIEDPDDNGVGEIVARTVGMFKGYFKNDQATADSLTDDGWLRTGDAGYFDDVGRLVVIDRASDIATTAAGYRFSPQFIENKLKYSPFIGECVVLGNGRPFLAAIICIRYSLVSKWAEAHRIAYTTYASLAAHPEVIDLIGSEVDRVNASLPESQRLRRFLLLYKELDADDGELTRTRKVRRTFIDDRYQQIIEAIYSGRSRIEVRSEVAFEDGRKGVVQSGLAICDVATRTSESIAAE